MSEASLMKMEVGPSLAAQSTIMIVSALDTLSPLDWQMTKVWAFLNVILDCFPTTSVNPARCELTRIGS